MRYSFDALSGLVTTHFGQSSLSGHVFVFFSKRRDRMKLLFWDSDGFALYYKRLERGTFSWVQELNLDTGGEIQASDFAMILTGINPRSESRQNNTKKMLVPPVTPQKNILQLV
ncbi:MAG: IS66 family insertion sequence element accessory protein TnpB [Candidatus Melainabacteria bacterium]|nr:IS66 family insertion sequence element accessory protein TnpB [Candidatus Melainabacteria bacterium]